MPTKTLVYIIDVYGRRSRIALEDYRNSAKTLLRLYNQFGSPIAALKGAGAIHRGNIKMFCKAVPHD